MISNTCVAPPVGQRQRRDAEQQDEDEREALLLEDVDQAAERLLAFGRQPALDLVADLLRRGARLAMTITHARWRYHPCGRSRSDHEPADQLSGESELKVEVSNAARKIADQPTGHQPAIRIV